MLLEVFVSLSIKFAGLSALPFFFSIPFLSALASRGALLPFDRITTHTHTHKHPRREGEDGEQGSRRGNASERFTRVSRIYLRDHEGKERKPVSAVSEETERPHTQ